MGSPEPSTDRTGVRPAGRRLIWYLIGWLAMSALAVVAVLVLYRPVHEQRAAATLPPLRKVPMPTGQHLTAGGSPGWSVHFFYTAVEQYHHGPKVAISGCPEAFCAGKPVTLGSYPNDFLAAVRKQGSGAIGSGKHAGRILNWSAADGYWLDTLPRGSDGIPLQRFATMTSGTPQLPLLTEIRVVACGTPSRRGIESICSRLRTSSWRVSEVDAQDPDRQLRMYIGPEDCPDFAAGPWMSSYAHVVLRIG